MLSASFLDFVRSGGLRDYRDGRGSRHEFSGASRKRSVPETCVTFISPNMGDNALGKVGSRSSWPLRRLRGLLLNGRTCNPCLRNDLKFLSRRPTPPYNPRCPHSASGDRARGLADVPSARLLRRGKNLKRTKARTPCERRARASLKRTLLVHAGQSYKAPGASGGAPRGFPSRRKNLWALTES